MTKRPKTTPPITSLLLFCLLIPSPLIAGAPTNQIQATVEKVIAVLKDPNLKSKEKREERISQLRKIIYARFDFAEMSRRSLGPHWRRRTPSEREEFIRIFTDLLERTYVRHIDSFNDEKFVYLREKLDENYAEVGTQVVTRKGEEFSVNYKTHLVDGEWKIYDVVIENISMVNNYRSQFKRVLSKSSYEELVQKINNKLSELIEKDKVKESL
jgi:phospholipid transport system substrate-binding protein